jgi:hypothetical protein
VDLLRPPRTCHLPECQNPPVVQWQRRATDAEAQVHADGLNTAFMWADGVRRIQAQQHLTELRNLAEIAARDEPWMAPRFDELIAKAEADLAAVPPDPPVFTGEVLVTVLACEDHAVHPDIAAAVHEQHCLTADPCACDTEPLPETGPLSETEETPS